MNRLKELREDVDLKQTDIGKLLNLTRGTCAQYELGILNIPIPVLKRLSNYYDTSIDYILYRTDERKPYMKSNFIGVRIHRLKEIRTINFNTQILRMLADYFKTSTDYIVCNTDEIIPYEKSKVDWKVK